MFFFLKMIFPSKKYHSFCCGIIIASVTWIISIYLYWVILAEQNSNSNTNLSSAIQLKRKIVSADAENLLPYENQKSLLKNKKKYFDKHFYKNSEKLKKHLKVKYPTPTSELPFGLDELGLIKTVEDLRIKDEGYKRYAFNALVSSRLGYHRPIKDTRNPLCKEQKYPENLPSASIVICFFNEHDDTLKRSIHSILNRTPVNLLHEIILVDDNSTLPNLHDDLQNYIESNKLNKVKLIKTKRREGLIRARMIGASETSGQVLVFLDSHIEANVQWLEPLLTAIVTDKKTVATPIIDVINADTFHYSSAVIVRGGFNWGLHFNWESLPVNTLKSNEDFVKPIKSPTMAGGLFAIDRDYFYELGQYDAGMDTWGGENLEISFRLWMCGGKLVIIPCSRVGHVFRKTRPYTDPEGKDSMLKNSLRVAHVWMDEYKEHFLNQRPNARHISFGDISSRLELRKKLKCKSFDWYLKNVYPELLLPSDNVETQQKKWKAIERPKFQPWNLRERNYIKTFQIKLANTKLCITTEKDTKTKGSFLILKPCLRVKNQIWYETDKSELILAQLLCLDSGKPRPKLSKCHEMGGTQAWKHHSRKNSPIYNIASGTCLRAEKSEINSYIIMDICSSSQLVQWDILDTS